MALTWTTTSGGKDPGATGSWKIFEPRESLLIRDNYFCRSATTILAGSAVLTARGKPLTL